MDYKILWHIIDGLRDELNIAQDGITDLNDVVKDLQAEAIEQIKDNKRLNDKDGLYDEVKELQAENDGLAKLVVDLKAELDNLKGENIDLINHADFIEQGKIKKVIDGFKAEIKELKNGSDVAYMEILHRSNNKLLAENKRLMKQVSSNSGNSSSTHTHTISGEIAEYMDNNPKSKGARMFLLPRCDFKKDGEHDGGYFYWEDGME